MAEQLSDLTDLELEEEIEARVQEQQRREVAALRAIRLQKPLRLVLAR